MYTRDFDIPEGITVDVSNHLLKVKGPKGEVEKKLVFSKNIKLEKVDSKIKASTESDDRKIKAQIGTIVAHVKNAIEGVTKEFTYKLKVIYSHFPVTLKVEGDKVLIQNFLGERIPRVAKIVGKTKVKIEGADVIVTGASIDEVSQTAANIEQAARIVGYDKKIFQDGVYITSKNE
jgi:large subunit ribosomal protein L6